MADCLLHATNYSIWAYENALLVHNVSSIFASLTIKVMVVDWRDRENLD